MSIFLLHAVKTMFRKPFTNFGRNSALEQAPRMGAAVLYDFLVERAFIKQKKIVEFYL
tara:strand:- start:513 stop:686 length:174 start_codon:yes stop_codon:yes gene_type:complete